MSIWQQIIAAMGVKVDQKAYLIRKLVRDGYTVRGDVTAEGVVQIGLVVQVRRPEWRVRIVSV